MDSPSQACTLCGYEEHTDYCHKPDLISAEAWWKMSEDERQEAEHEHPLSLSGQVRMHQLLVEAMIAHGDFEFWLDDKLSKKGLWASLREYLENDAEVFEKRRDALPSDDGALDTYIYERIKEYPSNGPLVSHVCSVYYQLGIYDYVYDFLALAKKECGDRFSWDS